MSRIAEVFANKKAAGEKALIPYITLGFPGLDSGIGLVKELAQSGADIIEVGVPFSDPLADGPTIQASSHQAIENGMTLALAFEQLEQIRYRQKSGVPLVMMTYFNIIFNYGLEQFAAKAAECQLDGVVIPDLPFDESAEFKAILSARGIDLIFLITPNSKEERIRDICERASGFIYLVSVNGVTGGRSDLPEDTRAFVEKVRRYTDLPLALGFGISGPDTAKQAAQLTDGVIVGSALIQRLKTDDDSYGNSLGFIRELQEAINE
ncbi:tryptophan synthase subunit alpha [Thalassomonas viridans]|uniref:Tryptophan synthase alpha chain n=1 Tax=Thalassomonas viridans TaxID=137584 RepID=A0AAF0CAU3_9GAMM|nr:tryptophan synthase subunit alpha [Thalassomonas viridans]WDE08982.1 tryptophan synthase subunit alpha [Thalassomonas viridans]